MNNLRDQKTELKSRARTGEGYVPGGKSLLEMDQEVVERIHMGKTLLARGGRSWASGSQPREGSILDEDDERFESVSLVDARERGLPQDEDVPLAVVRERIVTARQDAEESLVDRIRRLKMKRQEKEETVAERLARIKSEQGETLAQRAARIRMSRGDVG
jgi:hypothetical protein